MITRTYLKLNSDLKETIVERSLVFPYIAYNVVLQNYPGNHVTWHWHEELEIIYALTNTIISTQESVFYLHAGESAFINSNVLHKIEPLEESIETVLFSQVFDRQFIAGTYNSILDEKYIRPVTSNKKITVVHLPNNCDDNIRVNNLLKSAREIATNADYCYELEIRTILSQIWILLIKSIPANMDKLVTRRVSDSQRIKEMMSYIHANYNTNIKLADIAKSVNISERECLRCFRKCLDMTPVEYLLSFRIQKAVKLLAETSHSISTISQLCGFTSGSYFGKVFRKHMNITPQAYRNNSNPPSHQEK